MVACFHGLSDCDHHAPVLEGPGRITAFELEKEVVDAERRANMARTHQRRAPFTEVNDRRLRCQRQKSLVTGEHTAASVTLRQGSVPGCECLASPARVPRSDAC